MKSDELSHYRDLHSESKVFPFPQRTVAEMKLPKSPSEFGKPSVAQIGAQSVPSFERLSASSIVQQNVVHLSWDAV